MNKVFKAICDKTRKSGQKITDRAIRYRIDQFQKRSNIVSRSLAENAYAYEMDIDVQKFLGDDELKELQEWLSNKPRYRIQDLEQRRKQPETTGIRKKVIDAFGLPQNLSNEANRMAKAYPDIYVFENLIRHVVMTVLERKYGENWWNTSNTVSNEIRKSVEGRKKQERENRWHSRRGAHEIFYTDFSDLSRIIATNYNDFKDIFADLEIEAEMRKLEYSRNIIAHNNPLPLKEIKRIEISLDDLRKQLNIYVKTQQK